MIEGPVPGDRFYGVARNTRSQEGEPTPSFSRKKWGRQIHCKWNPDPTSGGLSDRRGGPGTKTGVAKKNGDHAALIKQREERIYIR